LVDPVNISEYLNCVMKSTLASYFVQHNTVINQVLDEHTDTLVDIAQLIVDSYKNNGKLVLFGNGGSAQDAEHIAAELVGKYSMDRKSLPAIALTTNTSILTALPNDFYYHHIFERQVEGLVESNDVVIGFSTSGNAGNVIRGILKAREKGAKTVGFTGHGGGELKDKVDILFDVPSKVVGHIQEAHITAGHIICELIEQALFRPDSSASE